MIQISAAIILYALGGINMTNTRALGATATVSAVGAL